MSYFDFILYASSDDSCVIINVPCDEVKINEYIPKLKVVYFKYFLKHLANYQRI